MFWQDIFISSILPKTKVISALSSVFEIDEKMIRLIKDIEEITQSDGASIVCQTYKSDTEFPLRLSVYIIDEKLVPQDEQVKLAHLSSELECAILMSDASNNPYSMLRISFDGSIKQVNVNIEEYDNAEEFDLQ